MPVKLSKEELKDLLKASYDEHLVNVGNFILDVSLSGTRVKVFTVLGSTDVVVTHRGSQNVNEWFCGAVDVNVTESSTFRTHKSKHSAAVEKYGASNITSVGHGRGGIIAAALHAEGLSATCVNLPMACDFLDYLVNSLPEEKEVVVPVVTCVDYQGMKMERLQNMVKRKDPSIRVLKLSKGELIKLCQSFYQT